jgi:hypothetical protein
VQCATHPDVETELGCGKCGKPICARCLVHGPVGARCRECANIRRLPAYNVSSGVLVRGAGAALSGGAALGIAWWLFNPLSYFFFGILVGLAVGYAAGELVSLSTNRRSGPPLQVLAGGAVVVAYLVRVALLFVISDWVFDDLRVDLAGLIALAAGILIAAGRVR